MVSRWLFSYSGRGVPTTTAITTVSPGMRRITNKLCAPRPSRPLSNVICQIPNKMSVYLTVSHCRL
jgi:hypothetical protein